MAATKENCAYCFDRIVSEFDKKHLGNFFLPPGDTKFPIFVTWKKKEKATRNRPAEYDLRGCIGTFSPVDLVSGLSDYAFISAFEDSRFDPLDASEIPSLQCHVSLLIKFEIANHPDDWEVGKHGIQINFQDPKTMKKYNSTYLPEVAAEQEWDQMTTLQQLVAKAGYRSSLSAAVLNTMAVKRYQSSKESLNYTEYKKMHQKKVAEMNENERKD